MNALSLWIIALAGSTLGLIVTVNNLRFSRRVQDQVRVLWTVASSSQPVPVPDLRTMPAPVRRYLDLALERRPAPVARAVISHGGTFRPGVGRPWLPTRGTQHIATDPPGFVWWGRVRTASGLWIDARDESLAGTGNMLVKAASSWTLADVSGPEVDQGALLRLLGEMAWVPTAFADPRYVTWTAVDDTSADATLRVGGRAVEGRFHFGADGLPARFTATRYRDVGEGKLVLTPFIGVMSQYRLQDGMLVPFELEAAWQLDDGLFPYARFVVDRVEFDPDLPATR